MTEFYESRTENILSKESDKPLDKKESPRPGISPELMERALANAAEGFTISDALLPDQPIIYVNRGFENLTGYSAEEIVGKNCRFLQGDRTEPETVRQISEAITNDRPCSVEILNHRKDGSPFWNRLSITPVKNDSGLTTHYIGIQTDLTERRDAEAGLARAKERLEEANRKMKKDLEAAARIQQTLLPSFTPNISGYSFSWTLEPCDELAGDTLDIHPLGNEIVALYALDVSGHGVPSALLSATLSHWLSPKSDQDTILASVPGKTERIPVAPERITTRLNSLFPMNTEHPQYFTLGYGLLDIRNHAFTYVSAGHCPAVHLSASGKITTLDSSGPPVGLLPKSRFREETIPLYPGDRVFIYTDGLIEATNREDAEFGFNGLCRAIMDSRELPLEKCLAEITGALHEWTRGTNPEDDLSILAFERNPD